MSLTKKTRPYEVLVRFNENGKVGAYKQSITEVLDGDTILTSSIDNPESLDLAQLQEVINSLTEQDWFVSEVPEDE